MAIYHYVSKEQIKAVEILLRDWPLNNPEVLDPVIALLCDWHEYDLNMHSPNPNSKWRVTWNENEGALDADLESPGR